MSAPYVVEQQLGPMTWYVVSGEFPTAYMAKQAWESMESRIPKGTLGIYRHGIQGESEGMIVSAVSLNLDEIRRAMHMLRLAVHYPLGEDERLMLIGRRARVVSRALQAGRSEGRLKWRRPEGRPAKLDPDTLDMVDRPGQG